MATLNELQQRLAVASERNRQNAETREKLETEMKETYGCATLEELRAFAEKKSAEADKLAIERDEAFQRAEKAVAEVEAAVAGKAV